MRERTNTQQGYTMDAIEIHAIAKAIATSKLRKARPELEPGEYPVKLMAEVDGTLKVAQDSDRKATSNLLSTEFLALAFHYCGVTREAALSAIEATAELCLENYIGGAEAQKASKKQRQEILKSFDPEDKLSESLSKAIDRLPKVPKAGEVSFNGVVNKID